MKTTFLAASALALTAFFTTEASATACPLDITGATRIVTLDPAPGTLETAACVWSSVPGSQGNIGNAGDLFLGFLASPMHMEIDDSGDGDTDFISGNLDNGSQVGNGTSGVITLFTSLFAQYQDIYVGLKFGVGFQQVSPISAVFSVSGPGTFDWSIANLDLTDANALSHVVVYGKEATTPPIPLPASALLLIGGLAGLGAAARRRKARAA